MVFLQVHFAEIFVIKSDGNWEKKTTQLVISSGTGRYLEIEMLSSLIRAAISYSKLSLID